MFDEDCSFFKRNYEKANNEIAKVLTEKCSLNLLPAYQEMALIHKLFSIKEKEYGKRN